jgi:flagellar hook-length control protein FliK
VDHPNNHTVASPAATIDVGAVATSIDPELPSNNASASSNVQTPVAPTNLGTSTASVRQNVVREPAVPMEIQDAVSAIQEATNGDSHIRVRLNPRQRGNILVDISRTDNGVVARLEVESAATRVAVLETLPDLQQSLGSFGRSYRSRAEGNASGIRSTGKWTVTPGRTTVLAGTTVGESATSS